MLTASQYLHSHTSYISEKIPFMALTNKFKRMQQNCSTSLFFDKFNQFFEDGLSDSGLNPFVDYAATAVSWPIQSYWIKCRRIWAQIIVEWPQQCRLRPKLMHDPEWIRWPLHGSRANEASMATVPQCMACVDLHKTPDSMIRECCHTNRANRWLRSTVNGFVFRPRRESPHGDYHIATAMTPSLDSWNEPL